MRSAYRCATYVCEQNETHLRNHVKAQYFFQILTQSLTY